MAEIFTRLLKPLRCINGATPNEVKPPSFTDGMVVMGIWIGLSADSVSWNGDPSVDNEHDTCSKAPKGVVGNPEFLIHQNTQTSNKHV